MRLSCRSLRDLWGDESGGAAIEYGLIAALIILVLLVGFIQMADANSENYRVIEASITA